MHILDSAHARRMIQDLSAVPEPEKTHQRRAVERYIARLRYEADMLDQCLTQQSEATTRA